MGINYYGHVRERVGKLRIMFEDFRMFSDEP